MFMLRLPLGATLSLPDRENPGQPAGKPLCFWRCREPPAGSKINDPVIFREQSTIAGTMNQQESSMRAATEAITRGPGSAEAIVERIIASGPKSGAEALKELRGLSRQSAIIAGSRARYARPPAGWLRRRSYAHRRCGRFTLPSVGGIRPMQTAPTRPKPIQKRARQQIGPIRNRMPRASLTIGVLGFAYLCSKKAAGHQTEGTT
jgi:hypothetical protein